MSSIISNFDFSNVQFNSFSNFTAPCKASNDDFDSLANELANQSSKNDTTDKTSKKPFLKTSYDVFDSYVKQLSSNHITEKKLKEAVQKYFHDDVQACLKVVNDKIQMIKLIESSKSAFLVYADTTKNKSSFNYPNTALYNYIVLNDTPEARNFIITYIRQYNFTEHNYTNYSRLFFDIDLKFMPGDVNESLKQQKQMISLKPQSEITEEDKKTLNTLSNEQKVDDLVKLFNLIKYCCDTYTLTAYGTIEYKSEFIQHYFSHENDFKALTNLLWFKNDNPDAKTLSGHIYLNGYTDRESIMNYMKYLKYTFKIESDVFDVSVYKTKKQPFRMSYSAKINEDAPPRLPSEDLVNYITQHPEIIDNLRMAPRPSDIEIKIEDYTMPAELVKKVKTFKQKSTSKSTFTYSEEQPSIFRYIKSKNEIIDIKTHVLNEGVNNFDLAGLFLPYLSMPLSIEEFQNEFMNIALVENEEYTKEINQQYLSKALQSLSYNQDYKNIQPLYMLKKYTHQHLSDYKDECAKNKVKPNELIINEHSEVLEGIDYFITKYSKISFAAHHNSFFDISTTRGGTKEQKILYNVYGLKNGIYIEPLTNKIYNNISELRHYYKLSGDTAKYIEDTITYYDSQSEYELYIAEYEYAILDDSQRNQLTNDVRELINILKTSFYNENDMNYYLGFLIAKLKNKKSLNKGILNQPRINEGSGKDSLKTFITDLLDSYISIMCPNVENINKPLNGGYFKSDLIIFQEIPRNVKDIENFINRLKENSCVKNLTLECKGKDAFKIVNTTDFMINTNHPMEKLFYNKNDCEALLKRFKVLERKTINMNDPHVNQILDQFGHLHNTHTNEILHAHAFYLYLMSDEAKQYHDYYNTAKDSKNEIEQLYIDSAVESNDNDTIITHYDEQAFIIDFKNRFYLDQNKQRIKIKSLLSELMVNIKEYKDIKKPDTIKHKLLTSRIITYEESTKKYTMDDEQIKSFYNQYYTYEPLDKSDLNIDFQLQQPTIVADNN